MSDLEGVSASARIETATGPVVFVVADESHPLDERCATKEELWKQIFDRTYEKETASDPTLNTVGFVSSYTGEPVPEAELRAVVDAVTRRALALKPKRVLEIGVGTGMILFRIAPACERFVGVDLSPRALAYIASQLGPLKDRVELVQGSALDLGQFADGAFDLVVMNSTVQYFPGVAYLVEVLRRLERLIAPGGHILLGDVRSLPLARLSYEAFECYRAADTATAAEIRARVAKVAAADRELLLDPCILHALRRRLPRLRRTYHALSDAPVTDEFTQFRFNMLLAFDGEEPAAPTVDQRGIPNARLAAPLAARAWLASAADSEPVGAARPGWSVPSGVDPAGERGGVASGQLGTFDLVRPTSDSPYAQWMPSLADPELVTNVWRPIDAFASDPLRGKTRVSFVDQVRKQLGEGVRVVALDAIPTDPAVLARLTEEP